MKVTVAVHPLPSVSDPRHTSGYRTVSFPSMHSEASLGYILRKHSLALLHTCIPCNERTNEAGHGGRIRQPSDSSLAALYLFAHADLHDGVVDERLPEVFVFLLLETLHVQPGLFNMFPAIKTDCEAENLDPCCQVYVRRRAASGWDTPPGTGFRQSPVTCLKANPTKFNQFNEAVMSC